MCATLSVGGESMFLAESIGTSVCAPMCMCVCRDDEVSLLCVYVCTSMYVCLYLKIIASDICVTLVSASCICFCMFPCMHVRVAEYATWTTYTKVIFLGRSRGADAADGGRRSRAGIGYVNKIRGRRWRGDGGGGGQGSWRK